MTHHTDAERPWWRDRADEIELQVAQGKMSATACYTQMVQLLDADRRAPAAPVPQGWKLVPVKPTAQMKRAAQTADMDHSPHSEWLKDEWKDKQRVWSAMLAAAPQPPEAAPVQLPEPQYFLVNTVDSEAVSRVWFDTKPQSGATPVYTEQQVRELLVAHGIGVPS